MNTTPNKTTPADNSAPAGSRTTVHNRKVLLSSARAHLEDLAEIRQAHGEKSREYRDQLDRAAASMRNRLPELLETYIQHHSSSSPR